MFLRDCCGAVGHEQFLRTNLKFQGVFDVFINVSS